MANSNRGIVFRIDGGRSVGMGHIVRCHWLASALRDMCNAPISFCMNQDEIGISVVQSRGWPVMRVAPEELGGVDGDALINVIDLPGGVSADAVRSLRQRSPRSLVVLMDGTCSGRIEADLIVGPIERLPDPSSWRGFCGERYEGAPYAILDPAFVRVPRRVAGALREPRILVSMGGSDPYGLTLQALRALDGMEDKFQVTVALGPAFLHQGQLRSWLASACRQYECKREDSLLELMVNSDLALVSVGTTVYELAAAGLPAIGLSITEDHAQAAEIFAQGGSMMHLGLFSTISAEQIQSATRKLLRDQQLWLTMAQRGQALVDGKGADRVAKLLLAKVSEQSTLRRGVELGQHTGPELVQNSKGHAVIDCQDCGFAHLWPKPTAQELAEYYARSFYETHSAPDWAEKEASEQPYWELEYADRLAAFSEVLQQPTGKLLDVGCGGGWLLSYAKARGWDVLGIEPSESMWKRAASRAPVLMGTFPGVDVSGHAPFDAVHLKLVMEHVAEPLDVLGAVRDLLRPGGVVAVQVPNDFNPLQLAAQKLLNKDPWWVVHPVHVNYFNFESLERTLRRCGFEPRMRDASYPMEWFLLQGIDYIGRDDVGRKCHGQRMALEKNLETAGLANIRRGFLRWLASQGIGREAVVYAVRSK